MWIMSGMRLQNKSYKFAAAGARGTAEVDHRKHTSGGEMIVVKNEKRSGFSSWYKWRTR